MIWLIFLAGAVFWMVCVLIFLGGSYDPLGQESVSQAWLNEHAGRREE